MSDVGKLRRPGGTVFPTFRKSANPFAPEMGEIDFSQDLLEYDAQESTSVHESEHTEQAVIRDENRRKQFKYRQRKKKEDEEQKSKEVGPQHIDLQA